MWRWEKQTPFTELMALETVVAGKLYRSKMGAWGPGRMNASYGGHVFAQAVWAASQVVEEGMVVHNVHGYFTLVGLTDRCFVYEVTQISEGGRYCTRLVLARQPVDTSGAADGALGNVCFWSMISFKRDEDAIAVGTMPSHQEAKDWKGEYGAVLRGKKPWDHGPSPSIDAPWFLDILAKNPELGDVFPGLILRKVDLSAYNKAESPLSYRTLTYYRLVGNIPRNQPNLHACAHLYASDRNGMFLISRAMGFADMVVKMGSLSHSVVFHVGSKDLLLEGEGDRQIGGGLESELEREEAWCVQEGWTPRSGETRGLHQSKLWDARGVHIASTWQDGIVKKSSGTAQASREEILAVNLKLVSGRGSRGGKL